ncbi:F-box/WD repeat-containing protein 8 [Indicator indicator]|uniref:F-box/WD repeat-containing protein 8 n=1 Tax=Indicator indicator TaxID=1002788 RepID=UPI0023DFE550|nr:F-box/WD repeat-containing protein 8 [Indicator indicator]
MAGVSAELELFRRRWREELAGGAKRRRREVVAEPAAKPESSSSSEPAEPGYLALARGLLDGGSQPAPARRSPSPARPAEEPAGDGGGDGSDDLLGQLIRDLNEINEVPFFDVQLPYELALKIFQYLGKTELGRCAQVSRTWKVLAEDEVLWYQLCQQEGYLLGTSISDHSSWKLALRNCHARERTLTTNWKNRIGAVSQLQYELGKVLCDVHSWDGVVIAGYTSGEVRLWDTRTWDYTAPILEAVHGPGDAGPQPHVSFVRINSTLAVAAYEDGTISVWSLLLGQEPIHHYQHNQRVQALALASEGATVATASGFQVKVESPNDRGVWQTAGSFEIQKLVKTFAWLLNEPSQILLYNLETSQCLRKMGNSIGDFTCVNLQNSPPNMLVTGNKDRRVRVFDLRCSQPLCSFYAHQLGVTAVQMDDWKVVSGGGEGLVCVWDQRMGTKLWEMHARHPVRHVWFNSHSLITANIPEEKAPRGATSMDDDFAAHRKHRGTIYAYEFSVDQLAVDSVLPICRSSYDEATGYNYNIGLTVPYDNI